MLFAPLKSIFTRFSNILCNFNLGSVVVQAPVLAIIGFTLLTVEGVCAAWLPTVATPFPLARQAFLDHLGLVLSGLSYFHHLSARHILETTANLLLNSAPAISSFRRLRRVFWSVN